MKIKVTEIECNADELRQSNTLADSFRTFCAECLWADRGHIRKRKRRTKRMAIIKQPCDPVNHPAHYTDGRIEVIEYIEDKKLGYCLGNAVKYISRAGKKDPAKEVEDLEKAVWYIQRRIKELKDGERS